MPILVLFIWYGRANGFCASRRRVISSGQTRRAGVRVGGMDIRIQCLCVDSAEPKQIAAFWEAALGWRRTFDKDDQVCIEPPEGSPEDGVAPDILFLKVPEGKAVKNRLHLDLRPKDQAAEVARLEALGGSRVDVGQGAEAIWIVLADPDGNEFCVLKALSTEDLGAQQEG